MMSSKKLSRTTYRDPTLPGNPVRSGDSTRAENSMDMDSYYMPLEQVHGGSVHGWGVASGLRAAATNGNAGIDVFPGVALDVAGRHVSLAEGANAEVGPNADAPGSSPTLAGVTGSVKVPTDGQTGQKFLTIQWWETFDTDAYNVHGIYRYIHTPWLRLVPAAGFSDDGGRIVLARVNLDPAGNVTSMTEEKRRQTEIPVQHIELRKGERTSGSPNFEVENTRAGDIRSRDDGGIEVTVPAASDHIEFSAEGSAFLQMTVQTNDIVGRRNDGKDTIRIQPKSADIHLGTREVSGDITMRDSSDRIAIQLNAEPASLTLGTEGRERGGSDGEIYVRDHHGQNSIRIDGGTGDIVFRGKLRDPAASHSGVGHNLLALTHHLPDLTDGGWTTLHKHNIGKVSRGSGTDSKIGVISGWIELDSPDISSGISGTATVRFSDWVTTSTGIGFKQSSVSGYQGNFRTTPHAIAAPTSLRLSTLDETYFTTWVDEVSSTEVKILWNIDTPGGIHVIDFFVLGGIT